MFGDDEVDNEPEGTQDWEDTTILVTKTTSAPLKSSSTSYQNSSEASEVEVSGLNATFIEEEHNTNGTYSYTQKIKEFAKNAWVIYNIVKHNSYLLPNPI